jgi:hypothetical protein
MGMEKIISTSRERRTCLGSVTYDTAQHQREHLKCRPRIANVLIWSCALLCRTTSSTSTNMDRAPSDSCCSRSLSMRAQFHSLKKKRGSQYRSIKADNTGLQFALPTKATTRSNLEALLHRR